MYFDNRQILPEKPDLYSFELSKEQYRIKKIRGECVKGKVIKFKSKSAKQGK